MGLWGVVGGGGLTLPLQWVEQAIAGIARSHEIWQTGLSRPNACYCDGMGEEIPRAADKRRR